MFEESLVESTPLLRTGNRWPALISLTIQTAFILALISIPIFHPELVQLHTPSLSFIAPPPRPAQPPPPPERIHITTSTTSEFSAPAAPPMSNTRLTPNTAAANSDVPNLNPIGIMTGDSPNPFAGSGPIGVPSPHVVPAVPGGVKPGKLLVVSTGVSAGLLLAPIQPIYPPIARAAHVGGTVIIQAIISKTGQIESAHAVSGPAMLQPAAIDAVRTARYHPFLLNGEPTEVETTISINFRLGS